MADEKLTKIRHSLAHVMAAAVKEILPSVKFGIGPVIENGFYYDFDLNQKISEELLPEIEKKMRKIITSKVPIQQEFILLEDAIKNENVQGQKYKVELLKEIKSGKRARIESDAKQNKEGRVSYYKIGKFSDLCRGPHVKNTDDLPTEGFKLTHVAGAYWKGDSSSPQLQRIYAAAFQTKKELEEYLWQQEEAKKRDHKKLGIELDLFTFSELIGPGLPLWTPKGTMLRNLLDDFVWELRERRGYKMVDIPHITKKELYEKSGHWDKFKDELFKIESREGHFFAMKPMNCPHHIQIFDRHLHSYRNIPHRYASTTKCYRDEQTGELNGISRTRAFTQDDAHVFCRKNQIKDEFNKVWDIVDEFYKIFGFGLEVRLSFHDPNKFERYLGNPQTWKEAEEILSHLTKERSIKVTQAKGEAAFYGPKIDFMGKDSLGREWQLATIQLDLNMPERFDLNCINEKGQKERIYLIHAAIMGSLERFISILIEHYAGAFPVWLAPVQAIILPISEKFGKYTNQVFEALEESDIRIEIDSSNETIGKRIREAEKQKIPYILIAGEKELKSKSVAVRERGKGDTGQMKIDKFIEKLKKEIREKK